MQNPAKFTRITKKFAKGTPQLHEAKLINCKKKIFYDHQNFIVKG